MTEISWCVDLKSLGIRDVTRYAVKIEMAEIDRDRISLI